jgi:hypothetical protein
VLIRLLIHHICSYLYQKFVLFKSNKLIICFILTEVDTPIIYIRRGWTGSLSLVLAKNVLIIRDWTHDQSCAFCSDLEMIHHLFLSCPGNFHLCTKFNRYNNKGIFLLLSSFQEMWHSTLSLSVR